MSADRSIVVVVVALHWWTTNAKTRKDIINNGRSTAVLAIDGLCNAMIIK